MNETAVFVHEIVSIIPPIIIGLAIIICLTIVVVNIIKAFKQKANVQTRSELYSRMIDKFGAAPEFIAFLQSEDGRRLIEENITRSASPMSKILLSIQIGVILILLGAGLLTLSNIFDNTLGGDLYIVLAVSGTISAMVGAGFVISSVISYKLSKRWGLLTTNEEPATKEKSPKK